MKKLLAVAAPALLLTAVVATDASDANAGPELNPNIFRFFATTVSGNIKVPGAQTGPLTGFNCGNIHVIAQSKEMVQNGGLFATPKWTRFGVASGNYASGECKYSMFVPPNSPFFLTTTGAGNYHCDVIAAIMPGNGVVGPVSVPFATNKNENLTISSFNCEVIK